MFEARRIAGVLGWGIAGGFALILLSGIVLYLFAWLMFLVLGIGTGSGNSD